MRAEARRYVLKYNKSFPGSAAFQAARAAAGRGAALHPSRSIIRDLGLRSQCGLEARAPWRCQIGRFCLAMQRRIIPDRGS